MADKLSDKCLETLRLLRERRNVLISGAPGTGKSRLLNEVAAAFIKNPPTLKAAPGPVHVPDNPVPIPAEIPDDVDPLLQDVWPAPKRKNRQVFKTAFHQNYKNREFISGLVPVTNGGAGFNVVPGKLYLASQHAKSIEGASLLIIDEINRGPAVQIFGGSIVAIEPDKRLSDDGSLKAETQIFDIVCPETGELIEYALPEHLYILAAMNQADASVEPLDVAFLRRWAPFNLRPDPSILRDYFGLAVNDEALPPTPGESNHVYEAAVRAWEAVNGQICLGRGAEFELGHGVFMTGVTEPPKETKEALAFVSEAWSYVRAHIDEVFFGDMRGIAATLNVGSSTSHPYKLIEATFADEPRLNLKGPAEINADNIYPLLTSIVGS